MGIKKIILLLLSLSFFAFSNSYAVQYSNAILDGDAALQDKLKNLDQKQIDYIIETFDGKDHDKSPLDAGKIQNYLKDDKYGMITECAAIINGDIPKTGRSPCVLNCGINIVKKDGESCTNYDNVTKPIPTDVKPSAGGGDGGDGDGDGTTSTVGKSACTYDGEANPGEALKKCITGESGKDTQLVNKEDLKIDGGFKQAIIELTGKIASFLALGAIFAIVYGSLMLTLSAGEDDKIKKAKDIIKWGILGFLAIISAGFLIALVVNLIYGIAG